MIEPSPTVVDALMCPNETAAYLALAQPASDRVQPLAVLDPARLSHAGRVDALVAIERTQAWLAARQQELLSTMTARAADTSDAFDRSGREWVREDVSCALRLSGVTAQRRLDVARDLVHRLPETLGLLDAGEISYVHARALRDATVDLTDAQTDEVQRRVLARAKDQTLAQFSATVRRAVASVAAVDVEERHAAAVAQRRLCVTPQDDGMAELWALLPADGAEAVLAAVTAVSAATTDDDRTADQRRADALVDLVVGAAMDDPRLPRTRGVRPSIQVTVALSTLLGADDEPGDLAGHGPVPASMARRIASDTTGTWRRLVTDAIDGRLLDYGRTTYRPPSNLSSFVITRDRTCAFPTCRRRAERCDLDHRIAWADGGPTSAENMQPLCRRHHAAKHEAGWRIDRQGDGTFAWTSPTRHRYGTVPPVVTPPRALPSEPDPPPF